jgi:uncharacterized protein YcbX
LISVSGLSIFPVKSLAGVEVPAASLDRFGLVGDRRWMVVDEQRRFMTQREFPQMALISVRVMSHGIELENNGERVWVALPAATEKTLPVQVWEDIVPAQDTGNDAAHWLSRVLGCSCRLVYMADNVHRYVDGVYASAGETVSFADGFPILLVSQASLDDLNSRLQMPVLMNRFRPNLVVTGCEAYAEDGWQRIRVGDTEFEVAKPCSRCVMPSIDQSSAAKDPEILRVLASYRRAADRKTYFGQNLLYAGTGELRLGDSVEVLQLKH